MVDLVHEQKPKVEERVTIAPTPTKRLWLTKDISSYFGVLCLKLQHHRDRLRPPQTFE